MDNGSRRAIVTGGGTGIGAATARRLAAEGMDVVIVGRRMEVLTATAASINKDLDDDRVSAEVCDLTDPGQVTDLGRRLGRGAAIDVLVANAGGAVAFSDETLTDVAEGWRRSFDLNVTSAVLIIQVLQDQLTRPGARIIAMSSIAGLRGGGAYGAAKGALNAYVMGLSAELAPEGITVNAVAPGFVPDTEFWEGRLTEEVTATKLAGIPLNRPGTPEEVAETVAYLAGPGGGWTTGQIIQVNGGQLLGRG